jgi:hypothetical protein
MPWIRFPAQTLSIPLETLVSIHNPVHIYTQFGWLSYESSTPNVVCIYVEPMPLIIIPVYFSWRDVVFVEASRHESYIHLVIFHSSKIYNLYCARDIWRFRTPRREMHWIQHCTEYCSWNNSVVFPPYRANILNMLKTVRNLHGPHLCESSVDKSSTFPTIDMTYTLTQDTRLKSIIVHSNVDIPHDQTCFVE